MDGNILRELRKEKGLTQQQLADAIGMGASTIRMMEINQRKGSIEVINLLAQYFGVSIDYLEGNTEFRNASEVANEIINQLKNYNIIKDESNIDNDIISVIAKHVGNKKSTN